MTSYRRVLATTDFSECALHGVREAARLAGALGAELVLVSVVHDEQPYMMLGSALHWGDVVAKQKEEVRAALERWVQEHLPDTPLRTVTGTGHPAEAIVRVAQEEEADLIVIASRGHGLLRRMALGSTAQRVAERAACPVMVVHPPQ